MNTRFTTTVAAVLLALSATGAAQAETPKAHAHKAAAPSPAMVPALLAELAKYQADEKRIAQNLQTFDNLDFDVFTNQKWDRLHESHAKDIVVHWPDGHSTTGIDVHIADLKAMFVYAPDTRIQTHPVKFGQGEWTGVIGVMEGTFTKPMPIGEGQFIQPTGKAFKLTMATIGHWKGTSMDAEYLFWDNATFMKQLGLGQ
ncbi:ester cyclase [Hydrogenophaga sp. MI9]|uniref:ester cyclase n=1 Tax=Hydrogenophaga sp. MI9 TaxID=3453719 RepID=UPI003EF05127